jgi:hypothetical protein
MQSLPVRPLAGSFLAAAQQQLQEASRWQAQQLEADQKLQQTVHMHQQVANGWQQQISSASSYSTPTPLYSMQPQQQQLQLQPLQQSSYPSYLSAAVSSTASSSSASAPLPRPPPAVIPPLAVEAPPSKRLREPSGQAAQQAQQQHSGFHLSIAAVSEDESLRPDFFSPTVKQHSGSFVNSHAAHANGLNGATSTAAATASASLHHRPNGTAAVGSSHVPAPHGKKRLRSEDVVEELLHDLSFTMEVDSSPAPASGGGDSSMQIQVQRHLAGSPTPSPNHSAAIGSYSTTPLPLTPLSPLDPRTSLQQQQQPYSQFQQMQGIAAPSMLQSTSSSSSTSTQAALIEDPPQLVDPIVLTHLASHVPALPSLTPGLSVEVLVLMLLWRFDISKIQAGGPLSRAQFMERLKEIGCESDQQLQLMLQNMLVEFATTPTSTHMPSAISPSSPASASSLPSSSTASAATRTFKSFYIASFGLIHKLCSPPFHRLKHLDHPTARYFLVRLLGERFPAHMHPFLAFLDERARRHEEERRRTEQQRRRDEERRAATAATMQAASGGAPSTPAPPPILSPPRANDIALHITLDQWTCLLEWCMTIHPYTLQGYEVDASWPVLMDHFVEWLCSRAPNIRLAESSLLSASGASSIASSPLTPSPSGSPNDRMLAVPGALHHSSSSSALSILDRGRMGRAFLEVREDKDGRIQPLDANEEQQQDGGGGSVLQQQHQQLIHNPHLPIRETPSSASASSSLHRPLHVHFSAPVQQSVFSPQQQSQQLQQSALHLQHRENMLNQMQQSNFYALQHQQQQQQQLNAQMTQQMMQTQMATSMQLQPVRSPPDTPMDSAD